MPSNSSFIDPQLAMGPILTTRSVPARTFDPIVQRLKTAVRDDGSISVDSDPVRDRLLADYRAQFNEQVVHDLSYNLQQLWHWATAIDSSRARSACACSDAQIRDQFRRLNELRQFTIAHDAWSSNRLELKCGNAFRQFYCDALALGDRLWRVEHGIRFRRRRPQKLRRIDIPACASYGIAQALINVAETGIPGTLIMRPLHALLPATIYASVRGVCARPVFRFAKCTDKIRRILTPRACAHINDCCDEVLIRCGVDEFYSDALLFDRATGKTKHNIILVIAHRHPIFDLAMLSEVFNGRDYGIWSNARCLPKSAMGDPLLVLVEQAGKKSMEQALAKSVDILSHLRLPLVIYVDGTIPYPCYGQQMRVKRGVRLLLEYLQTRSAGSGRRTFIIPVSFDDAVSFLAGLDPAIRITFHRPICTNDIASAPLPADPGQVNWGDPLLNYLESFFLANSGQIRHGWQTPSVIATVRRTRQTLSSDHTLRGWVRRRFHPSLFDLSRATRS